MRFEAYIPAEDELDHATLVTSWGAVDFQLELEDQNSSLIRGSAHDENEVIAFSLELPESAVEEFWDITARLEEGVVTQDELDRLAEIIDNSEFDYD